MPVFLESKTKPEKLSPTFERRIAHLKNIMTVVCDFTNGPAREPDKPHSHPHEQITYVAEGELFFFISDEKHHLTKGDIFTVPPEVPHCIQNISGFVRLIDSFSPIREDFLKKS
ncbi:MAG: cupin domain-containing protein [Bacteroidia bacterium]|nr:cupin domain-containing protein [Bacteroidia bacterium]